MQSQQAEEAPRPLTRRERRDLAKAATMVQAPEGAAEEFAEPLAQTVAPEVPVAGADVRAARDEFAVAAEALNFTGEQERVRVDEPAADRPKTRRDSASHRVLTTPFRRFAAATASVAAVGAVVLMAVGTTMPYATTALESDVAAEAQARTLANGAPEASAEEPEEQLQAYVAGEDVESAPLEHVEGYEASTFSAMAEADGISTAGAFFDNDPTADIQWPFAVGTSMSSPFGWRWGRMHEGVDFTPGDGAPIQAVADGVVRVATEAGGAYGVNVYIDHVIDGELVTTHYAHMQYGSLRVTTGQRVEVGDVVGLTGNTGRSYGAHLHFEVLIGDTAIDPLPWLEEHANTHYSDEQAAAVQSAVDDQLGG